MTALAALVAVGTLGGPAEAGWFSWGNNGRKAYDSVRGYRSHARQVDQDQTLYPDEKRLRKALWGVVDGPGRFVPFTGGALDQNKDRAFNGFLNYYKRKNFEDAADWRK